MSAGAVYRERPLIAGEVCSALWTVRFAAATGDWLVLPDGCVDLVLDDQGTAVIAGPATRPNALAYPAGAQAVGLRLPPGAAPAVLRLSAAELIDMTVPVADLGLAPHQVTAVGRAQELLGKGQSDAAARVLSGVLAQAGEQDPVVRYAAGLLRENPTLGIGVVAERAAISPRQLLRRFIQHVGYGPKVFARVMRLQYLMALGQRHPTAELAWLAACAGYADHAHLVHDCRSLAGRTPRALLAQRATVEL